MRPQGGGRHLLVLVVAVLAGCGPAEEPQSTPSPTPAPLEALLQEFLASWSEEDVNRELTRFEESVAACMAEQGFSYAPADFAGLEIDLVETGASWGTAEFAAEYGYGLTTDPLGVAEAMTDPNAEYVATMSPAEQDAYFTALYGADYQDLADDGAAPRQAGGCVGRAQTELLAPAGDEQFTALQEEMLLMLAAAATDARLDQPTADWAACMADAGYPGFAAVEDAEASIRALIAALPQTAAPSEVTEQEIATAVADFACRADSGYDAIRAQVDREYQLAFLAEHRAELMEWLDHMTGRQDR